ncbi:hypothetical protein REPUB_Repub05bG0030900 [Reevesia pubescens]
MAFKASYENRAYIETIVEDHWKWRYASAKVDAVNKNINNQVKIKALESWEDMERQHLLAISLTKECLHSVVCKVPFIEGANNHQTSSIELVAATADELVAVAVDELVAVAKEELVAAAVDELMVAAADEQE